jgi:hypothetical protein
VPPVPNPWEYWTPDQIATATACPLAAVQENWPRVHAQLMLAGIFDRDVQIGVLGTIAVETASSFEPVREAFFLGEPEPAESYRRTLRYYPYYGRGFVQLTWESNYAATGPKVAALWGTDPNQPDFDFVGNPDKVLEADFAAAALAIYFRDTKTLQGYRLVDACRAHDWEWVRRLVQGATAGLDRVVAVANALLGEVGPEPTPPGPSLVTYNPDEPPHPQNESFDCSQDSLEWALYAVGRAPSDVWLTNTMIAQGVMSRNLGLLDASGAGLAGFVTREYGEFGYSAENVASVTFDEVAREAGYYPVLIGGRTWNHWSGVRSYDATNDVLILANPSEGWMGVGQTLNRGQFDQMGPFSLVRVLHPDLQRPPSPSIPETDAEKVARLIGAVGYLGGDVADRLEEVRAVVDDGMVRPFDGMTTEEAAAALAAWWERWDHAYQEIGAVGAEMRRVRNEQLR